MSGRARWISAFAAAALATVAEIALVHRLPDQGFFAKYVWFADRILGGTIPARVGDLSPAYLWLIVAFRALHMSVAAMRDVQIVALGGAALLCGVAARRIAGPIAGIAAAVLVFANRAALVTATELEPETLILLLLAGTLAALAYERMALAGLLLGIAITARPVAVVALLLVTIWLYVGRALSPSRRAESPPHIFLAAALLPVLIVLTLNRATIMDPGTVLYDSNNPLSTGCAIVLPRIVADLDREGPEPDYLHVAYRLVAARATGQAPSPRLANRYWARKALSWMGTEPLAAARLFATKALLSIQSYDVYDLATTWRKAGELAGWPFVPFGALTALAVAALVLRRSRIDLVTVSLFAIASIAVLIAFNVTSRQRDALLAPLAILAGIGVAEMARRAGSQPAQGRAKSPSYIIAAGAVVAGALLLQVETNVQREDTYVWRTSIAAAMIDPARASVLRTAEPPLVDAATLRATALSVPAANEPLRFDAAIALEKAGAWREADAVLATLTRYVPHRDNHAVSSVAFYRGRAALHLGRDPRPFLARARDDSPADPNILALTGVTGDAGALRRLDLLHDPFTRDYALACAWLDAGDRQRAYALRDGLLRRFPEWNRPRDLR